MQFLTVIVQVGLIGGTLAAAGLVLARRSLRLPVSTNFNQQLRLAALFALLCAMAGAAVLIVRLADGYDASVAAMVLRSSSGIATVGTVLGAVLVLFPGAFALAGAVLLALSAGLAGHASTHWIPGGIVVALHVGAAAWWLGGLLLLLRACGDGKGDALPGALERFSRQARLAVLVLLAAGGWLAFDLIGLSADAFATDYAKVLVLKLAMVACLLSLALYNRVKLTPMILAGDASAGDRLRRTMVAELVLVGLVVVVTATLSTVMLPPHA